MPESILDIQQYKGQDLGTHKIGKMGRKSEAGQLQKLQHHIQDNVDPLSKYPELL